mmetsp:Transcript_21507/g.55863  ORF Transcript_21507/g.55863 Transcript_21507/m.55863 type:complete len:284 (-) Transcript_21507:148-999(-)|eukprot:CAMPEP_0113880172 /NCGR_PEP_ID=MMETSP0780_2-20120614/7638_1 /TAXON_ID=652834 /ORGANISM="Palpitomonas bilix" /LENGTH=283 /DNA_ID=CAMNT_0000866819 /DNA_START=100 /DNA_END=951 /DNA_ORIENTATION=+ /assembly_acc=CAM_ASM_000599
MDMSVAIEYYNNVTTPWSNWINEVWSENINAYPLHYMVPIVTFIIHEVFYFGNYLPYFLAEHIPFLQKYKIQPKKENSTEDYWKCIRRLAFNHFIIEMPMILITTYPLMVFLGMKHDAPLPAWYEIAGHCILYMFIEDFYFYWIHRLLHYGWFYKAIHKVHHEFTAPMGMAAEYAHPIETVFLGLGTMLGPLMFTRHLATLWCWLIVRLFQTVEVHCGYDFPWSLNNWVPFWGGAEYHDYHHEKFIGPYSSTFTIWDRVFATDTTYRKVRAEQRAEAAKKKQN